MELVIERVGKRYRGGAWGLRGFTLSLRPGVLGLVGPNGAGKTTLMRMLATVTRPSEGRVLWEGVDIGRSPNTLREVLGYLPQDFGVYPNLNAVEFLEYLAAIRGVNGRAARRRIDELLELVNLTGVRKRALGGYSGGMRQRVGIAQALLNNPKLLIVDEPTAGLDPEERVRFRNLLSELSGERIVILSTHIVSDVEAAATEIAVLSRGRLLTHATPEALLTNVEGKVWECVVPSDGLAALKERYLTSSALRRKDGVHVRVISDSVFSPEAVTVAPTLEEAYLHAMSAARDGRGGVMSVRPLYHLAKADFLERVRRYSFWVVLAGTVFFGYELVVGNLVMHLGQYRGLYNSAWVGMLVAAWAAFFLPLLGFYVVKNAIDRDRQTRVGEILAATPMSKAAYLFGKFLSNLALLGVIVLVLVVSALVMQSDERRRQAGRTLASRRAIPADCSAGGSCRGGACGALRIVSGDLRRFRECHLLLRVHVSSRL